ncbi:DUF6326 family protein [Geodermatophilus chilensis]|uniref:DUF6326 family protein n=1 Tax=Geodermatophilus chilensis TaxID=2035835 RepID=UPI000C258267|nr:DUF6326 family protein [Geodermatophilus chilensis]
MRRRHYPTGPLEDRQVPMQSKLAAWWVSFMFLYVYVDILGLYMPGVVDDILAGIVWELEISQTWAFGALTLMAIPISMVALSMTLPARANRRANLVVAPLYVVVSVANGIGESWTYYFAIAIGLEVLVLTMIVRCAWTWPRTARHTAVPYESDRMQSA